MRVVLLAALLTLPQLSLCEENTQARINKMILESSYPSGACMQEAQLLGSMMDGRAKGVTLAEVLSSVDQAKNIAPERAETLDPIKMMAMQLYQLPLEPSDKFIPRYYKSCVKTFSKRLPQVSPK